MKFSSGTKLGTYEIVGPLGAGGMGEVYRARDSKLKREVAIKILPDAFARSAERVSRFQREAEVLASLNHPHIAAIHDLVEFGDSRFLVLELVEGETLADRIARGPIPIDESLVIARQIAEALEAAHEKGIIHRDLKPANIKLTDSGNVKVLDFGLAKAFAGDAAEVNLSNSPTLSGAATNAGIILGTAAYMSPEQAKGLAVDKRTDIFSLGSVLYEMLTGRQVFAGETVSEILARVIEREPDWSRLPKNTPAETQHMLRRSLQKDRNRRLQTATDARVEIEESSAKLGRPDRVDASAAPQRRQRLAWKLVAAVLFLAVVALAIPLIMRVRETPPADAPEMRVDLIMPPTPDPVSFAISPDGRRLVFVASVDGSPRLWLRPLDAVTAQPLAGTENATLPFWSPDSRSVGFFVVGNNILKRVDIGGGLPQTLTNNVVPRGGAWNPDGVILFTKLNGGLFRIPASGGEAVAVTKPDSPRQLGHGYPQFLPGGRQFLFYAGGQADAQGIYLGSLDAPETKRLTAADTAGLYAPPGWLLYIRQGTLVARRFDPLRGELTGDPVTVADPVGFDSTRSVGAFSVSAAGLVTYRSASGGIRRQLTWFDRSGKVLGTVGAPDENNLLDPALSPDGRRVAMDRSVQGNRDIWIIDDIRTMRFTFDAGDDTFPTWSPDGSRIAFLSNRKGVNNIYIKPSSGAGSEELLFESPLPNTVSDWSRDGRFLLGMINDPKTALDLWVWPLDGDRKPRLFLSTNFSERGPHLSPDGRWVSYQSDESGRPEIYVRPFSEPGGQWQISTAGGINGRWRHDGKEFYYIAPDGQLMAVPISTQGATLVPGTPVALFQSRSTLGGNTAARGQYTVAPDGRFLINVTTGDATSSPVTLLLNWKPPAK
jgi:Tol biopolymer transport system component